MSPHGFPFYFLVTVTITFFKLSGVSNMALFWPSRRDVLPRPFLSVFMAVQHSGKEKLS